MKHKNYCKAIWWLSALPVLFILAGILCTHAEEAEVKSIKSDIEEANRELGIMSRVLEAGLDRSGLAPWQPVTAEISAFDQGIKVQYIPKVCAIFTIPVNFAIFDPAKQPEQKEAPTEEKPKDLWEKYSRESGETGDIKRGRAASGLLGVYSRRVTALPSVDDEAKREELLNWAEERKERLRGVLLETLAQYGHRLKHLNTDKEKIVFMVQAPSESLSDPWARSVHLYVTQRPNNRQQLVLAGKPMGQANHYILVISNAKLKAAVTLEDLESLVAIEEYYY